MRIEYRLTFEDYQAAQRLNTRTPKNSPPTWWEKWQFFVYAMMLPAVWVLYGIAEGVVAPRVPGERAGSDIVTAVMVSMFPWLVVQSIIWLLLCRTLPPRDRRISRNVHIIVLLLMAGTFAFSAHISNDAPLAQAAEPWSDVLLGLAPSALFMLAYLITMIWYLRGIGRRAWSMSQHMHYPTTLDVDDTGLRVLTPEFESRYRWTALRRFLEDDRVFSVYISDGAFLIVPKHGFADPTHIERFRTILEIRVGTNERPAFEPRLMPQPVPPPLPATETMVDDRHQ